MTTFSQKSNCSVNMSRLKVINSAISVDGNVRVDNLNVRSVASPHVYKKNKDLNLQGFDRFNFTTKIELPICIPVVALLSKSYDLLVKLFHGTKFGTSSIIKDLVEGNMVLTSRFYPIPIDDKLMSQPYVIGDKFIGGDAILYLIENYFKYVQEYEGIANYPSKFHPIFMYLLNESVSTLDRNQRKVIYQDYFDRPQVDSEEMKTYLQRDSKYLSVNASGVGIRVIDNYCITGEFAQYVDIESIVNSIVYGNAGKGEDVSIFRVLHEFAINTQKFKSYVTKEIPVLPLGFRPSLNKRKHDPLTKRYNKIYIAADDLKNYCTNSGSNPCSVVLNKYKTLFKEYNTLIFGVPDEFKKYDKNFKGLMELLTGKEGIIRDKVQGAIVDYSGRTVITVDPEIPVDSIGVPESMVKNIFRGGFVEGDYVKTGRQPTLHLLSSQGFKCIPVKGDSLRLNPVVTPAFNADFDGDQMYVTVPVGKEAKDELKYIISNIQNTFYPKDGSCCLTLRHEMVYACYTSFLLEPDYNASIVEYTDSNDLIEKASLDLESMTASLKSPCRVGNKSFETLAKAILTVFQGPDEMQDYVIGVVPLTTDKNVNPKPPKESYYTELFGKLYLDHKDKFVEYVSNFAKVTFRIAELLPVTFDILETIDISDLKLEFENKVREREEDFRFGFDTQESFSQYYHEEFKLLEEKIKERVVSKFKGTSFFRLIESGARGKMSNLMQVFGLKGLVQKSDTEHFNTFISSSLNEGVNGLDHLIMAYGARQGIIDKIINTYAPGYLSRKMSHASRHLVIRSHDCGTTEGLEFNYDDLLFYLRLKDNLMSFDIIRKYVVSIIKGRYIVSEHDIIDGNEEEIFSKYIAKIDKSTNSIVRGVGFKLRSSITCNDKCCAKCYGINLITRRLPAVGEAIGHLAGPTVGEPMTQLVMKNFQSGGVAGVENITSSFDVIQGMLDIRSLYPKDLKDGIVHDILAPSSGYVIKNKVSDKMSSVSIVNAEGKKTTQKTIYIRNTAKVKSEVQKGEPLMVEPGDLDINDIIKYKDVDTAQKYILFKVYYIFFSEVMVNFKHFEALVDGMTLFYCTKSNHEFNLGNYYNSVEYISKDKTGAEFKKILRGLKYVEKIKNDLYTAIYLEDVGKALEVNYLTSGEDELKDTFVQATLGLRAKVGTGLNPNYITERNG